MKLLFDFLPIFLFFGTFHYAQSHRDWAAGFGTDHFGFLVSGGTVGTAEAPVLLATLVVIAATLAQVTILLVLRKKVDRMLWFNLALVSVLGGATVWFHNENFIKWKPTVLYWAMGAVLLLSQALFGRNLIEAGIGKQVEMPRFAWTRLNVSWIAFLALMGVLNLWVAYHFSQETWVNFKLGSIGIMFAFTLAQGFYVMRHAKPEAPAGDS